MDNTPKAQEAIASLNPLCVLRYSATHRSKQNLVYRLTPVDAYQLGLVKQISVISNSVINDSNKPYIALKSVSGNNGFSAKIEMDIENATGKVERKLLRSNPMTICSLNRGTGSFMKIMSFRVLTVRLVMNV